MKSKTIFTLFILQYLFTACNNSENKTTMLTDNKYDEGFVVTDKVKLQYLDWGGKGQVLVLICGLGDTPYLFQNLAGDLSKKFHVIGYSRRSHGKSITTEEKYDNATLVSDLKLLLDSLQINKASLLGWSMGGNEITEFATLYPDRVNKLIYFEAGYDLSDGGFEKLVANMPKSYLPDSSDMKSLNKYREWYHRFWFRDIKWNNALEANLLASVHVNSDSSVETIPNDNIFKSILGEAIKYRRSYAGIQAPSLVIYTEPFFYPADNNPETIKLYDEIENNIVSSWREANKQRIKTELRNAAIVDAPGGSHVSFLFTSHDYLVKTIDSFLGTEQ
jgi:pimeloyl-ACP methyl ester carboxylesterase